MLQAPQAGAPITVWVKRMDVAGARYVAVKGVDVLETVDDFIARWVADEKLDVRPSLVTLRLVKRGAGKPTAKQEEKAKPLDDPSLSLAQAKVTDTAWLLTFVAGTNNERLSTSVDAPGAYMTRTPWHPLKSADTRTHTRTVVAALAEVVREATEKANMALTAEVREVKKATEEVKLALNATGQLSLSTRTLVELYRDA